MRDRALRPPHCAIVSFRLGVADGVSVVAATWERALRDLGFTVRTVAGEGPVDVIVPGLALDAVDAPEPAALDDAFASCGFVVVENLLSIPMNLTASRAVARALAGRPAILHHHDPPWQRTRYAHITELPPRDPSWAHAPIDVWSYVQAGLFTVIGVFALLGRRGARAWMFGGGLATMMHSAVAMRLNPWCGVAVALGAALTVTSVLWKDPSPAATA